MKVNKSHESQSDSSYLPTLLKSFAMEQEVKDLEIINERADGLNEEALDVLDYQVAL
jgi:hypothetical protein